MGLFDELTNKDKFISSQKVALNDQDTKKLIFRGIVAEVNRYGGGMVQDGGRRVAPGSLKVYIPGITASDDVDTFNYYEPLLPLHVCPIPEIKEEVLILFESQERVKGYWIKRNDSDVVNYQIPNPVLDDNATDDVRIGENLTKGGQPFNWEEKEDIPNRDLVIPAWRRKPGDVPMEGRSNTLIAHTFNTDKKKGVIDIVTERYGGTFGDKNDESKIKDREFQNTKGSRIMLVTEHNIDKNKDWDLTAKPGFASPDAKHLPVPYIYMESEEFRFYSRSSNYKMNNAVLGNEQEKWLTDLIGYIAQLAGALDTAQLVVCGGAGQTSIFNNVQFTAKSVKANLNAMVATIKNHHSKSIFIN